MNVECLSKPESKSLPTKPSTEPTSPLSWPLCHFHSLPSWLQHNEYLISGHRPPLPSYKECIRSIFRLHTETINIWSHFIGFAIFASLTVRFMLYAPNHFAATDRLVLETFLFAATFCFAFSTAYHTFSCHSPNASDLFCKLDYCGIVLLIAGSLLPYVYYGFYCENMPKLAYLVLIGTLCILTLTVSLSDQFGTSEAAPFRAKIFTSFGMTVLFPSIHVIVNGSVITDAILWEGFLNICSTGAIYFTGALVYALKVPERFFPGKCDLWFHSHQLFHILVVCAAVTNYQGLSDMAWYRASRPICSADLYGSQILF
ncbi:adiponectin receptor protein [Tetranychus urticae]|uniref:Uncharacterized protein n=1 Tax=Tetranychus urticae TaxID=32264 RepID=T1KMN0_TETUR|nr:adiponectin receptor protein [Tetranychus urticae]